MQVTKLEKRVIIRKTLFVIFCIAIGWYLKARLSPQMPGMGAMAGGEPSVLVEEVVSSDISFKKGYIGIVEPIKHVNLRPQVSGYVEKVLFSEGSFVEQGDLLFVIEQKRYIATVELREAELNKAKANLVRVEKDYGRQVSLNKQSFASDAKLEQSNSDLLQARALVKQAQANLDLAKIDLDYTEVKAPISGYIGKAIVTEGNYVNDSIGLLARIVQTNPIRVTFSVSDKDFLTARKAGDNAIRTQIVLSDGTVLDNNLISRFSDNEVNSQTATIALYAEFANDKQWLVPGNYVNIFVGPKEEKIANLVPNEALVQDANGMYTFVVNKDNMVEQRRLKLGSMIGQKQEVVDGIKAGEQVIVQGLQKVKEGSKVKPTLIKED